MKVLFCLLGLLRLAPAPATTAPLYSAPLTSSSGSLPSYSSPTSNGAASPFDSPKDLQASDDSNTCLAEHPAVLVPYLPPQPLPLNRVAPSFYNAVQKPQPYGNSEPGYKSNPAHLQQQALPTQQDATSFSTTRGHYKLSLQSLPSPAYYPNAVNSIPPSAPLLDAPQLYKPSLVVALPGQLNNHPQRLPLYLRTSATCEASAPILNASQLDKSPSANTLIVQRDYNSPQLPVYRPISPISGNYIQSSPYAQAAAASPAQYNAERQPVSAPSSSSYILSPSIAASPTSAFMPSYAPSFEPSYTFRHHKLAPQSLPFLSCFASSANSIQPAAPLTAVSQPAQLNNNPQQSPVYSLTLPDSGPFVDASQSYKSPSAKPLPTFISPFSVATVLSPNPPDNAQGSSPLLSSEHSYQPSLTSYQQQSYIPSPASYPASEQSNGTQFVSDAVPYGDSHVFNRRNPLDFPSSIDSEFLLENDYESNNNDFPSHFSADDSQHGSQRNY